MNQVCVELSERHDSEVLHEKLVWWGHMGAQWQSIGGGAQIYNRMTGSFTTDCTTLEPGWQWDPEYSFITHVRREQAAICEARSKTKMEKYYNSKVRNTSFRPRDLVYQNNDAKHAKDSGKLIPKWEGSYEVTKALGNGAYKLRDHNGKHISRTWNFRNLKKCYVHGM
ncbi:hypothetical protein Tco_0471437 [Tanacetum coccineum]